MSRTPKPPRRHTGLIIFLVLVMLLSIAGSAFMVKLSLDLTQKTADQAERPGPGISIALPEDDPTEPPTETTVPDPVPEHVISTATIASTGDLLMHEPVMSACRQSDGTYDFSTIFQYLEEYSAAPDFSIANLETTLYGPGKPYKGYPMFNCPDTIVDGAKNAGFDMLLTGNNHSFDTGLEGYLRTIQVVEEKGLQKLGTMDSPEDEKWVVQEINGIKVGLLSYTYETTTGTRGERPALNGLPMYGATYEYINCFRMAEPKPFLEEVEGYLEEMEAAGAEATIVFMHWGNEYHLKQNSQQIALAQGLCDLGVDVIIGGHPHVVQPVDLLTSTTDPEQKTVCLYSMGNAVSNQRQGALQAIQTAHTEDGVLFSVTFEKYSDGTVYLAEVELLPTWVNMHWPNGGGKQYNILPLDMDRVEEWGTMFGINEATVGVARNSYTRTMNIVGAGLETCQTYLAQAKEDREEYYYNLAWHPEMFETEPTEAVEETIPTETAAAA